MSNMTGEIRTTMPNRPRMDFQKLAKAATPYLFVGPGMLLLVLLMIVPIGKIVIDSFHANSLMSANPAYVGLENYTAIVNKPVFGDVLLNTSVFTVASVAAHLVIGMGLALLLNQKINRVALSFFRAVFILPWIFTAAVVALAWTLMLSPLGVFNYVLEFFARAHIEIEWLGNPAYAMFALVMINAWRGYPFVMVSILAGLQGIDNELYEAAGIDGADAARRFLHITLPQLRPILLSIGLLDAIWTFNLFPLIWLTTGGGPNGSTETIATFIYKIAFNDFKFAQASAMAVIAVVVTMLVTLVYLRYQRRT